MNINECIAVLVVSCDRYQDVWPPFFDLFWRFWPDCPFRVYLLSNTTTFPHANVTNLLVGDDDSWSDNLIQALARLNEEYVLLFIDDLLLCEAVDTAAVIAVLAEFVGHEGNYLRMNPRPLPDRPFSGLMGLVSKGTIYRTATVSSVWKKETLLALLNSGESPWEFEVYGAVRSDAFDGFYSSHARLLHVVNTVIKGKWERRALAKLHRLGVDLNIGNRPVMTRVESFRFSCCLLRIRILYLLPSGIRRRIKFLLSRRGQGRVVAARG